MKQLTAHIYIDNDYLIWKCDNWNVKFIQRIEVSYETISFKTDIIESSSLESINIWFELARDEITYINRNLITNINKEL
jgi:hypothetical protein